MNLSTSLGCLNPLKTPHCSNITFLASLKDKPLQQSSLLHPATGYLRLPTLPTGFRGSPQTTASVGWAPWSSPCAPGSNCSSATPHWPVMSPRSPLPSLGLSALPACTSRQWMLMMSSDKNELALASSHRVKHPIIMPKKRAEGHSSCQEGSLTCWGKSRRAAKLQKRI